MTPYSNTLLEICVDSPASAAAAEEGGANRIELCADLSVGGTTPSAGIIANTRENVELPIHVMIRPHGGWRITDIDFEVMKYDIVHAKYLGIDGIVTGILTHDHAIDVLRMAELIKIAKPLSVTFHRAFDYVPDHEAALNQLVELGVERVLTAGGHGNAPGNIEPLRRIVALAGHRIHILVGGGLTIETIGQVRAQTKARELHMLSAVTNPVLHDREGSVFPGRRIVDADKVRQARAALMM